MRRLKKTTMLSVLLLTIALTNCAYNPKVDTLGRSGTFDKSRAEQLTNDLIICKQLTDQNVNYLWKVMLQFIIGLLDLKLCLFFLKWNTKKNK